MNESRRNLLSLTAAGLIHVAAKSSLSAAEEPVDTGLLIRQAAERGRHPWLQVARGELIVNGTKLTSGDAVATSRATTIHVEATQDTDALLFDLA